MPGTGHGCTSACSTSCRRSSPGVLTAAAIVATVIALRHEQDAVAAFLVDAAIATGLVVAGRVVTGQLVAAGRRRRLDEHRTVLIGGGGLSAEIAQILRTHPAYGLSVVGFVDDGSGCVAEAVVPQLGRLDDLDWAIQHTAAKRAPHRGRRLRRARPARRRAHPAARDAT